MRVEEFLNALGAEYFAGVPDSQLKALCDYLMNTYGADGKHHLIAANEGNAAAAAAGYHLATGKVPVVYMQNSGEGNIVNPAASLLSTDVYGIPVIFVVGWRGEPGVHDEPQHVYQGKVTVKLLDDLDIASFTVGKETTAAEVGEVMKRFRELLSAGKQVAFVIRKGALSFDVKVKYANGYEMRREDVIRHVTAVSGEDQIISTTGKASRELFEIRAEKGQSHGLDFLTVGSMGHSSSIALGIALQKPEKRFWIIDGDGAMLMHMGSLAVLGHYRPENLVHIVINNGAHETVGGQPTVLSDADLIGLAKAAGYPFAESVATFEELDQALLRAKERNALSFIEVKSAIGAREDLGRPTTTPKENKEAFMEKLQKA